MEMNKLFSILVLFALLTACSYKSKNTNASQEARNVNIKDSIQKGKVDLEEISKESKIRFIKDIPFYNELLSKLDDTKDTIYICSRHLLEKFKPLENHDSLVKLEYKQYEVIIKSKVFNENVHSLDLVDTIWKSNGKVDYLKTKNLIDGRKAYGIDGNIPRTELSEFIIKVNQEVIKVSNKYFNDIFNVNLEKTEVYFDPARNLIFVYINGSDAAGSYSVKYVINKTGYITRIITDFCGFDFIDGINYDCV